MADNVEVKMGDTCLEKQNSGRLTGTYLSWRNRSVGVKIDRDLSWRTHINHLHKQCMAKLAAVRRASRYLPQNIRLLSRSIWTTVVWNHCGVALRDRVERIQKYILRTIHGKLPRTSSEPFQHFKYI